MCQDEILQIPLWHGRSQWRNLHIRSDYFTDNHCIATYSLWERMHQDHVCMCSSGGIGCDGEDFGQSRRCLSSVEIYNPDTDTWRAGPTLPTSLLSLRTNASNMGVVGGKLYLCGYYKGAGQLLNICQLYFLWV